MTNEERLKQQRKNAVKTAAWLFLVVILIAAVYAIWFNTWIVNKLKAQESMKGNNLTKIVEPKEKKELNKPGEKSDATKQ